MAWPLVTLTKAQLDSPDDDPSQARIELESIVDAVNAIMSSRGVPNGVAELDDAGRIPISRLTEREIPIGTTISGFVQTSVPTGWAKKLGYADRVPIVNDSVGGNTGGGWQINSISVQGHAITYAEMAPHAHVDGSVSEFGLGAIFSSGHAGNDGLNYINKRFWTSVEGGGAPHTHGLSIGSGWRPAYYTVMICYAL